MRLIQLSLLFVLALFLVSCANPTVKTTVEDGEWIILKADTEQWSDDTYGVNSQNPHEVVHKTEFVGDAPSWSHDGKWIVYTTLSSVKSGIYLMKSDGTRKVKISKESASPVWSPNNNQIAYSVQDKIYIVDVNCYFDGRSCDLVPVFVTIGKNPNWSPNGDSIVFDSGGLQSQIYIVKLETNEIQTIFALQNGGCGEPNWSPVNNLIVFRCWGDNDYQGFYTIHSDGTNLRKIEIGNMGGVSPKWSPSGDKIAFISYISINSINAHSAVYTTDIDGTNLVQLTGDNQRIVWFSWMPPFTKPESCTTFCQ